MKIFLLFILFSFNFWAYAESDCQKAESNFYKNFELLEKQYSLLSNDPIIKSNQPSWSNGQNGEAVYLLHGFIGSPEEMSKLAKSLKQKSYTVVNDIIPGHGLDGFVANHFSYSDWQKHVASNINEMRKCFKKIHFVGFSTGALLIHDYIRKNSKTFQASSLTFYSPFYKSSNEHADFLQYAARFFTPVINTQKLYFLTHFNDIKIATIKTQNYLQQIPLDMAKSVSLLGENLYQSIGSQKKAKIDSPTLVFVSNDDKIANYYINLEVFSLDFDNLQTEAFINHQIPHHLMVNEVSSVANAVRSKTVNFIMNH